jgi:hypothetical protein
MTDTFTFTLDEETEKKLFELLTDVDVSITPSFSIKDKHGNEAEYVKVVRCKDCRWFSQTTLGMTYACWHGAETVWGQTGEHAGHNCCQRIESEEHYCGYGERKQTNENPEKD